jgi:Raf kinase inhibitor-like YbhB/YbcL family protein
MRILGLRSVFTAMIFLITVTVVAQTQNGQGGAPDAGRGQQAPAPKPMTMTTTAFADGSDIPAKYTQAGEQTSPAITWTNTPAGTISFVLHMHDMEGSRNRTTDDQLHWLVWNIPGTATGLPEGIPMGAQLQNGAYQTSASGQVYRGPGAPANGPRHHYVFELFALDTKVDVQPGADPFETRTNVMKAIQGHILGKAVYLGLFHRPQ